jgi:ribosomal protein S12 methylthiotransferase
MNVCMVSLGCDKNLVDSEEMLGVLSNRGFSIINDEREADVIIVNTCCFIEDAKKESIDMILEMAQYKETGRCKALIVSGCMAQRYKDDIVRDIPEADAVLGTSSTDKIFDVVEQVLKNGHAEAVADASRTPEFAGKTKRVITTGGYYEYLKIAEGCDKNCTYCAIPGMRGHYRSVPMEHLLNQAKYLAGAGTKELILVAQETTLYGLDLYGKKSLPELLRKLSAVDGIEWIRILYCYPEEITDELIDEIAANEKVVHYLDMPMQSAADPVLKRMARRTNQAELRAIVERLRAKVPDIALRTTLITGFPGETQEDFEETYRFVNEMEFDRLGVFTYSQEEGTPAASFEGQLDEEVKNFRRSEIMELQQEISFEKSAECVGKLFDVLIEGYMSEEDIYVGRTYKDAPGVDGSVFVKADRELMSGSIVPVRITGSNEYDLTGELEEEEDEFTE